MYLIFVYVPVPVHYSHGKWMLCNRIWWRIISIYDGMRVKIDATRLSIVDTWKNVELSVSSCTQNVLEEAKKIIMKNTFSVLLPCYKLPDVLWSLWKKEIARRAYSLLRLIDGFVHVSLHSISHRVFVCWSFLFSTFGFSRNCLLF